MNKSDIIKNINIFKGIILKKVDNSNQELKAYKFELIVRDKSKLHKGLIQTIGNCRKVWNMYLAELNQDYSDYKTCQVLTHMNGGSKDDLKYEFNHNFDPYLDLSKKLPKLKKDLPYLALTSSTVLQMKVKTLSDSVVKYRKGECGAITFKKKFQGNSFSCNFGLKPDLANNRIYIPKLGYIRYRNNKHRDILGKIINITISKEQDKFYISIQTKRNLSQINPTDLNLTPENSMIGIDMGVKNLITISDGKYVEFEFQGKKIDSRKLNSTNLYKKDYLKLNNLQKSLSKKKKGSKNFLKAKKKVSKQYKHIKDLRLDFLHKLSTAIVIKYPYIAVEDLKIKNMSHSSKGTIKQPGRKVKQKRGLNRVITRQGWGILFIFLEYKLKYLYGTNLTKVNPKNTSRKCNKCGYTNKKNRKSQSSFVCINCNHSANADDNASNNIKSAGLAELLIVADCHCDVKPRTKKSKVDITLKCQ